jgi:hypothetical protein
MIKIKPADVVHIGNFLSLIFYNEKSPAKMIRNKTKAPLVPLTGCVCICPSRKWTSS